MTLSNMAMASCNYNARKQKERNREIKPAVKNPDVLLKLEQMHIQQLLSFQRMCEQPRKQIPPFRDNK